VHAAKNFSTERRMKISLGAGKQPETLFKAPENLVVTLNRLKTPRCGLSTTH
jgi:hypothetical protein